MDFIEAIKKHNDEIYLWHEITNYLAMDPDGRVFGYEKKPTPGILGWSVEGESNSTDGCGCRIELNTNEIDNAWSVCIVTREQYETALAASKPEWDGEGLPPVGVEFEHSFHADGFSTWHRRRCTAVGKHGVLCVDEKDTELYLNDTNNRFRPIRSEDDKKRAECVIALSRIDPQAMPFEYGDKHSDGSLIGPFWYELYDAIAAGKIPHIRID